MEVPEGGVFAIVLGAGQEILHQCGGYACLQESATGTLTQVAGADVEEMLFRFFAGDKWKGWCDDGIDEETAAFIESSVPGFVVDRSLMQESSEAWIYGFIDANPAVLAWENGD